MRFSIVIPLHRDSPPFRKALESCLKLEHRDYEVIVVCDRFVDLPQNPRVSMVVTGSSVDTGPAVKRDAALPRASGEVVAFLDDDAFPSSDWLQIAESLFVNSAVGAIGGPGVTPPGSTFQARVGGAVYESVLGSGPLRFRFVQEHPRIVDDYPAYNLFVRADLLRAVGGWGTTFYGGEDTYLCEALKSAGTRIHYDPRLLVFHHRRPVFRPHMRQVANVGLHRGHFARRSGTSRRLTYFLPLLAVTLLIAGVSVFAAFSPLATVFGVALLYAGFAAAAPSREFGVCMLFPAAVFAHHGSYAVGFVRGLVSRDLDR